MANKKPVQKAIAAKGASAETKARVKKSRVDASGKSSRIKGHVSARTRRAQAKRDSK